MQGQKTLISNSVPKPTQSSVRSRLKSIKDRRWNSRKQPWIAIGRYIYLESKYIPWPPMLSHQDKRKGQNDGPLPNPFEEEMRIERRSFREARLQSYSFVQKGVFRKRCRTGMNFFSKNKEKEKKFTARNKVSLSYIDCSISIIVILAKNFQSKPITFSFI